MQKWYVVMAKPRQEHSSTSFLGQAGIEAYHPEVKECFNIGERRRFCSSCLLSGYFARFDHEREYRVISYSQGVRKVVAFRHIPAEVDPGLLREIQENIPKRDVVQVPSCRPGDVVCINSGPFVESKSSV